MADKKKSSLPRNRTKIVCTLGPASSSRAVLKEMILAGMDVARINFSHGSYESNLALLDAARAAAREVKRPLAVLQDLQGPRIRVGELPGGSLMLFEGKLVTLQAGVVTAEAGTIPIPYDRLAHDVRKGDRILLEDGTKELEVVESRGRRIRAKVLLGGKLLSYKGINVPTATLSAEALTEKDEHDLAFGLKQNIDFVALSFVRSAADVRALRDMIRRYLPKGATAPAIVVKIEKHEAIVQFDDILAEADGVMIARGDLGLETPGSLLPLRQKQIIATCLAAQKPVITATEMLGSMQYAPRPTRAEVSDVANAVLDHTDATMLSGESAMGKYPVRAVAMMAEIARGTEAAPINEAQWPEEVAGEPIPRAMAAAAITVAERVGAKAIIVTTKSGFSARAIASFRPRVPIFAATEEERTRNQLVLVWGITPLLIEGYEAPDRMVRQVLAALHKTYGFEKKDLVVVVSGLAHAGGGYDSGLRVVEL